MPNNSTVKIGLQLHTVVNQESETKLVFEQYLDKDDNAFIVDLMTNERVFKFDNSCRMFNAKGTLVGVIRLRDIKTSRWDFYTVSIIDDAISTTYALGMKGGYPYICEPEIIKWLVETNQYETFRDK